MESPYNAYYVRRIGADPERTRKDKLCVFAKGIRNEDSGSCLLQYEDGLQGVYHQNFFTRNKAGRRGVRLYGYKGTLEFDWFKDELIAEYEQTFEDALEVEANWARLKAVEKPRGSLMEGLPLHLPALMRAFRLTQRAARVGFDWEHKDQVWQKLEEELKEFQEALREDRKEALREELGDIFFTLVNLARFIDVDPEDALRRVTNKFAARFTYIEQRLQDQGKTPHEVALAEMDALWEVSKGKKGGSNG
jgi:NTP pyrophosphatase (non-canonical NTP hydrolase)